MNASTISTKLNHDNNTKLCFSRHAGNPILTGKDWPYSINSVFNAGATLLAGWHHAFALPRGRSPRALASVRGAFGERRRRLANRQRTDACCPTRSATPRKCGASKIRASRLCRNSRNMPWLTRRIRAAALVFPLHSPKIFESFERLGVVMPPDDKDAALLPRRINGCWALIHRPMTPLGAHVWISYSPDLRHWGSHKLMLEARRGAWWDANKIGMSPPPIETPRGLADDLSRSAKDAFELDLSAGPGALRSGTTGKMPDARRFLDVCARSGIRTAGRCAGCCVSLRVHGGVRWRHDQPLLRRRRFEYRSSARQHSSLLTWLDQRPFGTCE